MSTKAQIKANQQNAQKSTGPQTADGKAVVSQNAVKHGLFAAEAVISGEDPADYELYRDKYLAELLPVGMVESMLAERIVSLAWRLQRAVRMQNQSIDEFIECEITNPSAIRSRKDHCYDQGIRPGDPRFASDHLALGRIATSDWSNCRVLDRLLLYERRIENSLYKTINRLKQYQVIRQIELQDAEQEQAIPIQAIPKHGTDLKPVENMARMAMPQNRPKEKKVDLKKQSQFAAAHLVAKSFMKGDYNNMPTGGAEENKPNQSQFHTTVLTKGAGKCQKSLAETTG